ncbi:MAG TPA: SpoIID/LytB domain-containing protein [Pyrinomonadaceae bacterium]|nr:SpoIID/LytB domain-containing protein [Pyrinomonadaceae bacterium]
MQSSHSLASVSPGTPQEVRNSWLPRSRLSLSALGISVAVSIGAIALTLSRHSGLSASRAAANAELLDQRLQRAATQALGDRRGAIIVMDPQTGRIRAIVNPEIAFQENFPVGSAIKPFTALAALRSGLIDEDSRTLCHEKYSHHAFQTTCSHPRDLPPLNPTEAIAYSCNYYFSTLGEHLNEESFTSTLSEFGFGRKSGVNAGGEIAGQLQRSDWRPQNAIGEGNYLQATPIQVINAYVALGNGGRLFTPQLEKPANFAAEVRANIEIKDRDRELIVKGMRGAVRYGSAEKANLYSLPVYIFGKTGTATEINGFRTHGWFVGIASQGTEAATDSEAAPDKIKLAVLVLLAKGHGFEAAKVARPIFDEFASESSNLNSEISDLKSEIPTPRSQISDLRSQTIKVHLLRENVTRTVPFEDYVRGVVAAEGSMETEPDALKALAIAVRTYALKNLGRHARDGYDFCNSTHCERYRSVDLESGGYVSPLILEAVEATQGEILRDQNNELADSYFSASCGGATANMTTLWGGSSPPYLRGVRDEYCESEAHASWTDTISQTQLLKALQTDPRTNVGERLLNVSVLRTDASGRAELIALEGNRRVTIKGWDFKIIVGRALGWNLLKSSHFEITRSGSNFIFRGRGFGHGLGLCQEGAHVMAERGANYRQILTKYFPSTHVANSASGLISAFSVPPLCSLCLCGECLLSVYSPQSHKEHRGGTASFKLARHPNSDGAQSADLMWAPGLESLLSQSSSFSTPGRDTVPRLTLRSEDFRINYPATVNQREAEALLGLLQSSRKSLLARVAAAGIKVQFPVLEVIVNETTGDFVGRTGLPIWAAAATRGNKIELQPLETLKRRGILETTLRHELVHNTIDLVSRGRAPRWLAEGFALHLAGEGRLVARYEPRKRMTTAEIDKQLGYSTWTVSANEMRTIYAAAYGEVRRLVKSEGEANVWKRLAK